MSRRAPVAAAAGRCPQDGAAVRCRAQTERELPSGSRRSPRGSRSSPERESALEQRSAEARCRARRARAGLTAREAAPCRRRRRSRVEPGAERLAQIEARLEELRDAEKLFLRTRDELAARSEAVAARERLVAQKERELDEQEDVAAQWGASELTEMEARLRRLEQQQPGEQTANFAGGLRKLQQGTKRPQRPA